MRVYIVTAGCYSDYHIEAVFTEKENAVLYCAVRGLHEDDIEEWEANEYKYNADPAKKKYLYIFRAVPQGWTFRIEDEEDEVLTIGDEGVTLEEPTYNSNVIGYRDWVVVKVVLKEKDKGKAKKIAIDTVSEWVAKKRGIC